MNFDDNLCLKPPLALYLVMPHLAGGSLLSMAIGPIAMSGVSGKTAVKYEIAGPLMFIPPVPTVLVLLAWVRRRPTASQFMRFIWTQGHVLLTISAATDLALLFWTSDQSPRDPGISLVPVTRALLDVYWLVFIAVSTRVRDAFSDFPAAAD